MRKPAVRGGFPVVTRKAGGAFGLILDLDTENRKPKLAKDLKHMTTDTDIELIPQESGAPIPLEAGVYRVTVAAVEEAEGKQYGDQVKLYLRTLDETGDDGEPIELWAWASKKLTTQSKLFRWTANITGSPPVLGEPFRIRQALVDKECRAQLSEVPGEDGAVRKKVTDILRPVKAAAPEPDTCTDCSAAVAYYTADGKPFCEAHGPRAAAG